MEKDVLHNDEDIVVTSEFVIKDDEQQAEQKTRTNKVYKKMHLGYVIPLSIIGVIFIWSVVGFACLVALLVMTFVVYKKEAFKKWFTYLIGVGIVTSILIMIFKFFLMIASMFFFMPNNYFDVNEYLRTNDQDWEDMMGSNSNMMDDDQQYSEMVPVDAEGKAYYDCSSSPDDDVVVSWTGPDTTVTIINDYQTNFEIQHPVVNNTLVTCDENDVLYIQNSENDVKLTFE